MINPKNQWWENVFDEKYLNTYVDIVTPELTQKQIAFLRQHLQLKRGASILDLACGYGRHTIELARQGYQVIGLDYSKYFIELAKNEAKKQNVKVDFIRDDMRNLSFVNKFDAVISMFTSFGYFEDEKDNVLVLRKISRALKSKGKFLIDLNNVIWVLVRMSQQGKVDPKTGRLQTLPRTERLSNGLKVVIKEEFDPITMRWSMTRTWQEKNQQRSYKTKVRMFSLPEINNMMEQSGLQIKKVWGDFEGAPFSFESRRLVGLAQKA